ncbi:hypothetical protein QUR95_00405 [Candidatus Nasuia deltocephalinicola]|nr:hypothetical protein QUR95_00405 [Candidatus Nasuia deltocephalinicola]
MKKKIKNYLFFFFNNNLKYNLYKKNFYKLINFSKKNFDIISYDFFFFIFKNIDLNDLEIILNLIKILKINLLCKFPNDYLINYNEYKTIFFRKNFNFIKFYINKISKLVLKNYFLVNDIFNSNKKTFKKFESKIENLESNLNLKKIFFFKFKKNKKEYFIKKKRNNFSKKFLNFKKYLYSKKKFYLNKNFSLLNFLVKNIKKYKLKKNNNYKKLLFFIKTRKITLKCL